MSPLIQDLTTKEQKVVVELLRECEYAAGLRIHNLLFLAELDRIDEKLRRNEFCDEEFDWDRLVDCEFKCSFDGAYSEEIQIELEELDMANIVQSKKKIINENKYTVYSTDMEETDLASTEKQLIENTCNRYDRFGIDELQHKVKRTWLYDNTKLGNLLEFDRYIEKFK